MRSDKMFKICSPAMGIHKFYEWQPLPKVCSCMGYGPEGAFSGKLCIISGKLNKSRAIKKTPKRRSVSEILFSGVRFCPDFTPEAELVPQQRRQNQPGIEGKGQPRCEREGEGG